MHVLLFFLFILLNSVCYAADPWDRAVEPSEIYKRAMIAKGLPTNGVEGLKLVIDKTDFCDFDVSTMNDRQVEATILTLQNFNALIVKIVKCDKVKKGFVRIKKIDEGLAEKLKVAKRVIAPWHIKDPADTSFCHHYVLDAEAFTVEEGEGKELLEIAVHPEFEFKLRRDGCEEMSILTPGMDQIERINLLY